MDESFHIQYSIIITVECLKSFDLDSVQWCVCTRSQHNMWGVRANEI